MSRRGLELAFRETGGGAALLILHGLFGSATNFGRIARQLADRFRVISVDLRNHGASPHSPRMDYPAMAGDVLALMDRQRIHNATLMGHSMGGKVAMCMALQQPERLNRLIVLDIAPVRYAMRHYELFQAMLALPVGELKNRQEADQRLTTGIPEPRVRQFILQNLVQQNGRYRWRVNLQALIENDGDIAGFPGNLCPWRGGAPVLFMAGEHSSYLPQHLHQEVNACFPTAKIITLSGADHWLHVEKPELFLNTLNFFLTSAK